MIEPKDKEASSMYKQALELRTQALEVWPNANVSDMYRPSQSKDPVTALAQGPDVMNKVLEKQPRLFTRNNINHISQILEPCFNSKMLDAGRSLCSLLKMVFTAFPLESTTTPPDVKLLYQKIVELIQKHLAAVTAPQISLEVSSANSMISLAIYILKTLTEVQKNFVNPFVGPLVRVLQRLARDMGSSAGSQIRQGQRIDMDSSVSSCSASESGSIISNLKCILNLIIERVMQFGDCKRMIAQILHALLSEKGTDSSVLLCILDVVKVWIENEFTHASSGASTSALTPKEMVSYLQKLSLVDRSNFSPAALEEWDKKYIQLLYGVCSDSNKYPLTVRQEVFHKVERQFLLGVRAKDRETRCRFFSLYHDSLGRTLFIRLQFIIQSQDWENVADLVIPLRDLAFADPNVAYHLWVLVFPIVWVTLHKEEQVFLAKPMIALLSKDYHKRQQGNRPNVVQALLEGLHLSHPQPRMPSELIIYIGKTYNAWHISLALLESHVMLFMNEAQCSESLAELYQLLNEEDMKCGLWKKWSITAETRARLSLVHHGYWKCAQSLFFQAMIIATQGTYNNTVPKAEMCLWEEQWIHCAGQLSQWEVLGDFGKSVENYDVLLDSLWKVPNWQYMKDYVLPKAQVEETTKFRIVQAFFALHDRNANGIGEAENFVAKGVEFALEHWWQLPEMSVLSRTPLLQQFQQLVEVQESASILLDIPNGNKQTSGNSGAGVHNGYPELKDILETWRLRTPNEWDNLSVWYDLLQWRNEMYNGAIDAFKDHASTNPQLHYRGYRDKAWNVNKLAHIARKQGLNDVCVTILDKMYGHSTMDVQEAFVKIQEQAKAYLE